MNLQFQRLKDSLYNTWDPEDVICEETSLGLNDWKEINDDPSRYFNNYIQRFPILKESKMIAETPAEKRIWKEIAQEKAKWRLNRLISISFPFDSEQVSQAVAMKLADDVFRQFSPPVICFCSHYGLTYATFEERLVIVDREKLLFVMRVEED